MTIYGVRQRVACYVTRAAGRGLELLVREHVAAGGSSPAAAAQIPAGAAAPFETIEAAALREIEEESGLTGVTFEGRLGAVELGLHEAGGPSVTTYVHLSVPTGAQQSWQHTVSGESEHSGVTLWWCWAPLPLTFELAPPAAYLGLISR